MFKPSITSLILSATPNKERYKKIEQTFEENRDFEDMEVLNHLYYENEFKSVKILAEEYGVLTTVIDSKNYSDQYWEKEVYVIHFSGPKPWSHNANFNCCRNTHGEWRKTSLKVC